MNKRKNNNSEKFEAYKKTKNSNEIQENEEFNFNSENLKNLENNENNENNFESNQTNLENKINLNDQINNEINKTTLKDIINLSDMYFNPLVNTDYLFKLGSKGLITWQKYNELLKLIYEKRLSLVDKITVDSRMNEENEEATYIISVEIKRKVDNKILKQEKCIKKKLTGKLTLELGHKFAIEEAKHLLLIDLVYEGIKK